MKLYSYTVSVELNDTSVYGKRFTPYAVNPTIVKTKFIDSYTLYFPNPGSLNSDWFFA